MAAPAFAADLPVKARSYQQPIFAPSWTGFYIGGQVGYAHGEWDNTPLFGDVGAFIPGVPVANASGDGITGGLHVGYNYQMSNWVLGIEADFNWPSINNNSPYVVNPQIPAVTLAYNIASRVEHYGTVRARLGYAALPNTLLYVTGGWAYGETKTEIAGYGNFSQQAFVTGSSQTHSGWTVGVGVDYMLTANWILGAEYKHIDLGSETFSYVLPAGPVTNTRDLTIDEVTARVAYKF
jgi:outer membrane immunogenic protein